MQSTSPFVVAFDLDGTLYSSENILGQAYATAVDEANNRWGTSLVTPQLDAILALVGRPVSEILSNLFPDLAEARRHEFSGFVLGDLVAQIEDGQGTIFEGAPETLTELRRLDYPLVVVSNCRRAYLEAILNHFELADFFEAAACNEDNPELGKNGFLKKLIAGRRGAMVGDRSSDGDAARFAGVRWIGCSYGHAAVDHAEMEGADAIVRCFPEILPVIRTWANEAAS